MKNIGSGTIKSFGTTTPQTFTHDPLLGTITDSSALINIPNGDDFFKPNGESPLEGAILYQLQESDFESNTICFSNEGKEMLKLCPNGDIFVHGRLADNDKEVVDALREFLRNQSLI
jgi:hypothetical protein